MNARRLSIIASALLAVAAGPTLAADTTTFNVSVTITAVCNVDAAAPANVAFGSQPSTATNIDADGALNVQCTSTAPYTITLDNGLNGISASTRAMNSGATLVPYQLYRNAARGAGDVWGSTAGVDDYTGTGNGAVQNIPVYGRVASANFPPGSYSDTVTATIIY
jgi:spore coat protein U-like protein